MGYAAMMESVDNMILDMDFRLPRKIKKKFKAWLMENNKRLFKYDRESYQYFKYYSRNK